MSTTSEYSQIDAGKEVCAVAFTANNEHLVCGTKGGVQVWRVVDGEQVAGMQVKGATVHCVAASQDGRWIAAGTSGSLVIWETKTYELVSEVPTTLIPHWMPSFMTLSNHRFISSVDFSPDSNRLVFVDSAVVGVGNVIIWDIAICQAVGALQRERNQKFLAAKYSPGGDRIATATSGSVRVWDGNNGRLLVDVKPPVNLSCNLHWRDDHLIVKAIDGSIKEINAANGSIISEWPVPDAHSSFALLQHGKFIADAAKKTITLWDTATCTQLSPIQHTYDIRSIACSLDSPLIAIVSEEKITVKNLSFVTSRFVSEPELHINSTALSAWKHGQLTNAEAFLSAAISTSKNNVHHVLASRALVWARLAQWDAALVDAEESIKIQQSPVGYIAKCVALVSKGEKLKGLQVCDTGCRFHSEHITLFGLVKAIVLFMTGEHVDAMSRMDELTTDTWVDPALYVVQAYMNLHYGIEHMANSNYKHAIQSFENARIKLANRTRRPPLIVSLISGWCFEWLAITIQQRLCEALLAAGSAKEAGESILHMVDEEINIPESIKAWVSDFKYRCCGKLEDLGDSAVNDKQYDEAVLQYTTALLLDPAGLQRLLLKRSKAHAEKGDWEDALSDANKVIKLDASFPSGYETKFKALLGMGLHDDATDAFETMLSKMSESFDAEIRERSRHYIQPEQTKKAIRKSVKKAIQDAPLVLINTSSGRLCNKAEQAAAFESTPAFVTLIVSMTTHIDHAFIDQVVEEFYRYATFSHTWEGDEPLYEKVTKTVVYNLEPLPTHEKLRMFCKIVRDEGFNWAWSDTCCINKGDHFVLQEALVSMFKWYEGSSMTIIFLCDVDQLAELGALMMSIWNSRGWTLQEYHASKVVRIYTKDWTPYLGLTIHNHKESPEIISEMENATGISAQSLRALRPGPKDIREKLRLASTRQTTRLEDAAYSLLGIFSMTLPVTYGEGDKALGRLLSQLLTNSGDTSILAWTGRPNSVNSCLPTNVAVFSQPSTSHIPPAITDTEMGIITAELHASMLDLDLITGLYARLGELPTPTFAGQRMRLPCLAFDVRLLSGFQDGPELVFRAKAGALGDVEIRTRQDLRLFESLYLVHPWIDFLLRRHATGRMTAEEDAPLKLGEFIPFDSLPNPSLSVSDANALDFPHPSPLTVPLTIALMRLYQFLARLGRPFGALLLAPVRQNVAEYKRIATESSITAQVEITSATLERLIQGVRVLDVL